MEFFEAIAKALAGAGVPARYEHNYGGSLEGSGYIRIGRLRIRVDYNTRHFWTSTGRYTRSQATRCMQDLLGAIPRLTEQLERQERRAMSERELVPIRNAFRDLGLAVTADGKQI